MWLAEAHYHRDAEFPWAPGSEAGAAGFIRTGLALWDQEGAPFCLLLSLPSSFSSPLAHSSAGIEVVEGSPQPICQLKCPSCCVKSLPLFIHNSQKT